MSSSTFTQKLQKHNEKFFFVDMAYYFCSTFSQVHIARASSIPDHCSAYALPNTKEECLREMCDHAHDKSCPFCDRLKDTLKEIELNLREANLGEEYRDGVMYSVSASLYSNRSFEGPSTEIYSTGQGPVKHHRLL